MTESCICLLDVRTLPETEGNLTALAESLPPERQEKVRRRKGEAGRLALGAGLLLREALSPFGLPDTAVRYAPGGRPVIDGERYPAHAGLCLSLSHSGTMVLCLAAEEPAAVDIQKTGRTPEAVVRRCFGPEARAMYEAAQTPAERDAVFVRLWCRLEARVKLRQDWNFRDWNLCLPEPGFRYWRLPLEGYGCALYAPEDFVPSPVRKMEYRAGQLFQTGALSFLPDSDGRG